MRLIDMTISDFSDEVDSNSPAPGGGSVSALCSEIGVGLSRMMAHLTFGKKRYEENEESIRKEFVDRFNKLGDIRQELLTLIDKDTEAFNEVMKAMKMSKDTEKEKEIRKNAIYEATLFCIEIPFRIAKLSLDALELLEYIVKYGNKNAVTDIGVGTLMLYTGVEGAILNIKINISGLEDRYFIDKYSKECVEMLEKAQQIKETILSYIHKRLDDTINK